MRPTSVICDTCGARYKSKNKKDIRCELCHNVVLSSAINHPPRVPMLIFATIAAIGLLSLVALFYSGVAVERVSKIAMGVDYLFEKKGIGMNYVPTSGEYKDFIVQSAKVERVQLSKNQDTLNVAFLVTPKSKELLKIGLIARSLPYGDYSFMAPMTVFKSPLNNTQVLTAQFLVPKDSNIEVELIEVVL